MSRFAAWVALTGALACARAPVTASAFPVAPGTYNGRPPHYVGLLQLSVRPDGTATFLNVVSVHLPPVELERREVRLERGAEGQVCMRPPPEALEPCLMLGDDGVLTVMTREPGAEPIPVRLERAPPR